MNFPSKIRFALVFNRTGNLNRFGEGLIQIRAYQDRRCRFFSTGIYVLPKHWNKRTQRVEITHPTHYVYNQRISDQMTRMEAFEITMINRHGFLSIDRLHEYAEEKVDDLPRSFTEFFETELEAANYKPGSHKMYRLTLRKLKEFRKVVYFEDIRYKTVLDFDRFLRRQDLGGNSIFKHHARFRTFIKMAIRQDFLSVDQDPYKKFRPKRGEEPKRVYLTAEELARVEALELEDDTVRRVRDMFLLCCYTGLRYATAAKLTPANLDQRELGLVMTIKAQKTGKRMVLPLYSLFRYDGPGHPSAPEKLLQPYLEEMSPLLGQSGIDRIRFFPYSNQFVNRTLKEIAKRANINKTVSSHVARRSFACSMATRVKAPVLQRLLQHSRPDMTAIYIQLSNSEIEGQLEQIRWQEKRK